jgi:hypothetical protein
MLARGVPVKLRLTSTSASARTTPAYNVIGEIRGRGKLANEWW